MKIISNTIRILSASAIGCILLWSCSDVFETESSSVLFEEDNKMDTPNDSLYSVMGILSQFQRIGERSLLLGELRGDLMDVTSDASLDLQEIAGFKVSEDNSYLKKNDYYQIINNCNYAIANMDTSLVIYQNKVMLPEYAAIKAIRAWTYWQLGLAFGEVRWIVDPVVDVESNLSGCPVYSLEQLSEALIKDLVPYVDIRSLEYGTIDGYASARMFVPVDLMLGDLYLFRNDYVNAASMYYHYINRRDMVISSAYACNWDRNTRETATTDHRNSYAEEMEAGFVYSSDPREYHPQLVRLAYNVKPSIVPSDVFVDDMTRSMYFYSEQGSTQVTGFFEGDLRGQAVASVGTVYPVAFGQISPKGYENMYITKYYNDVQLAGGENQVSTSFSNGYDPENPLLSTLVYVRCLPFYTRAEIYLRYAEALNRLGKPSLAFAVMKYGLNKTNMEDATKVSPGELKGETYIDFTDPVFDTNVGTAERGRGRGVANDREFFVIPDYNVYEEQIDEGTGEIVKVPSTRPEDMAKALSDSILYVEDCLVDEMAAESCFEGHRFFDLMRIARHRNEYPAYMAEKVARRFADYEAMKTRLSDAGQWFLK